MQGTRSYWRESRSPRYSLLYALPLFVLYQALAAAVPAGPDGGIRNGADVILQSLFAWIAGPQGPRIFLLLLIGVGLWLAVRDWRAAGGRLRPGVFLGMLGETAVYAVLFGFVVGSLTAHLVPPAALGAPSQIDQLSLGTRLMLSLGAGLYEELLFRVLLVGAFAWIGRRLLGWSALAAGISAAAAGALIFSAFHYIGPYGDTFRFYSFAFRTIAGLAFSGLYLLRGFGITAWTHAVYDVLVMAR